MGSAPGDQRGPPAIGAWRRPDASSGEARDVSHVDVVDRLQERAGLASRQAAERALHATLDTLAAAMPPGAVSDAVSCLPAAIVERIRRADAAVGHPMAVATFLDEVARREGVDCPRAVVHARCVIELLDQVAPRGFLSIVQERLPQVHSRLFLGRTARAPRPA
ncbi:MAG TPA: DUF2267 domain-containing protein [Jiangellaceae bacterium]|nr:DUF2267 domain-containing protein [Jiangellaceae bacterium]